MPILSIGNYKNEKMHGLSDLYRDKTWHYGLKIKTSATDTELYSFSGTVHFGH